MARSRRLISSALCAAGVLLILGGLIAAQGFTLGGTVASITAVVALLYAGAVWLRDPVDAPIAASRVPILFDREGRALTGPSAGSLVAAGFPDMLRPEIERRCAAALAGSGEHFFCLHNGHPVVFDALPVRDRHGVIIYGLLLTAEEAPETAETRVVAWSATGR